MSDQNGKYDEQYLAETLDQALGDPKTFHVPVGIIRYDYGRTHGWFVRVLLPEGRTNKMFYDSWEGSPHEALKAAVLFRHEKLSLRPAAKKFVHAKTLSPDPSARIVRKEEAGKKQPYVYWMAKWYDQNHKVRTKRFSVKRFGEERAKALALAAAERNHNRKPKLTKVPDPYQARVFKPLERADVEVFSKINSSYSRDISDGDIAPVSDDPFAYEGERKMVLHQAIERKTLGTRQNPEGSA